MMHNEYLQFWYQCILQRTIVKSPRSYLFVLSIDATPKWIYNNVSERLNLIEDIFSQPLEISAFLQVILEIWTKLEIQKVKNVWWSIERAIIKYEKTNEFKLWARWRINKVYWDYNLFCRNATCRVHVNIRWYKSQRWSKRFTETRRILCYG